MITNIPNEEIIRALQPLRNLGFPLTSIAASLYGTVPMKQALQIIWEIRGDDSDFRIAAGYVFSLSSRGIDNYLKEFENESK